MRRATALAAVLVTLLSGAGLVAASAADPALPGPLEVRLTIRHSRFIPDAIQVTAGTTVRFVVDNTDPINHELIIGDQGVQDAHEKGTHAVHGEVPGEVSVGAGLTAETTYTFGDEPVLIGCHLPRHWDYGMKGEISVS